MKLASNLIMSITQAAMALAESERVDVSLDASRCLHSLDKSSGCELCVNACPVDAITFVEGNGKMTVSHDGETCVKCGLCLRVCPVEAFTGDNGVPDLLAFVSQRDKRGIVELACALHPGKEKGPPQSDVVVNTGACLAALGPSAIMSLMALGVAHVIFRVDVCQACPLGRSKAEINKTVAQFKNLFAGDEGFGSPVTLLESIHDDWPSRPVASAKAPPKSRRDFFRALTMPEELPEDVRCLMFVEMPEDGKYPPRERLRLIRALKFIPEDLLSSEPLETFQASKIAADEECTACGVCERACPTGAMQFIGDDGDSFTLTFTAGSCTDCGLCLTYCEPQALIRDGAPRLYDWLAEEPAVLLSGDLKNCRRCGAPFAQSLAGDLCPVCDYRSKNLFGSKLPAGIEIQRKALD